MKKDLEFYLYGKIDDNQYYVELMNNIQKSKLEKMLNIDLSNVYKKESCLLECNLLRKEK